jgi:hypothetical protein
MTQPSPGNSRSASVVARPHQKVAQRGHGRSGKGSERSVQAIVAGLVTLAVLGGVLWLGSMTLTAPTSPERTQAQRPAERPDDKRVGQIIVGQGDNCRRMSFDNSTGVFKDGAHAPCSSEQNSQPQVRYPTLEAVRKGWSGRKSD